VNEPPLLFLDAALTLTLTESNNPRGCPTIMTGHYSCWTPASINFKLVGSWVGPFAGGSNMGHRTPARGMFALVESFVAKLYSS